MFFGAASAALFYFFTEVFMSFAENFKKARTEARLTQQQVADALGLDRSAIAQYERGVSTPNLKNLPKICELLNVSLENLVSD